MSRRLKIETGTARVRRGDSVMRPLIKKCPPLTDLQLQRNRFGMLVGSILSQQISVHAARAIRARLIALAGTDGLVAERLWAIGVDELRSVGLSRSKAESVHDLARKTLDGNIRLDRVGRMNDDAVIEDLIQVRGIGVWTAQMFLIFSLGRLDVFPHADYSVRAAIRRLYKLDDLPGRAVSEEIASTWEPYRTIGTWYLWRSHEMKSTNAGTPASGGI